MIKLNTCSANHFEASQALGIFGVEPIDPGYIYVIRNGGRYKIGRSRSTLKRLREAKTWLPDMEIIGVKPFWGHTVNEQVLHVGFAHCWYDGEWFEMYDEGYENTLVSEFRAFSDSDVNANSINFIYWINGSGMTELLIEHETRYQTIRQFQKELSISSKGSTEF